MLKYKFPDRMGEHPDWSYRNFIDTAINLGFNEKKNCS